MQSALTARVAAVQQSNGYTLEIAIPGQTVSVNATPGTNHRAALSINDNDDPGTAKQELMLSHVAVAVGSIPPVGAH